MATVKHLFAFLALTGLALTGLALAQLTTETPVTSSGQIVAQLQPGSRLTLIARGINPAILGVIQSPWSGISEVTVITDRANVAQMPEICGGWFFRRPGRVFVVENVPENGTLIVDRQNDTVMVQGPLVGGSGSGATVLIQGDPMVRNLATQMRSAIMQKAVLIRAC